MRLSAIRCGLCVVLLAGLVLGTGVTVARAAELTAAEKQHFDLAKKYLAQLHTNLKLARDTAGPGEDTPPASKARLAQARLQTARQSAANVAARLEKLPADNPDVKTLQSDYDGAMKAVAALDERLTGKNAKPKAASDPKEAKLGYREENALKLAKSNVETVTALADALEKTVAEVSAAKDKSAIPLKTLRQAEGNIKEARRTSGFAEAQFKNLPPDHPSVKATADALKAALARVDTAEKALGPIQKQLMKQVDPAGYPDLQADNERLRELASMMLTTPQIESNRAAAAELVKQLPALKEESARIEKKYAALLGQKTGESGMLKASAQRFAYALEKFEEALKREKESLPQQIDNDLATAAKLAEEAVRDTKPLFFQGIAGNLRMAEEKLVLYEVLDPEGGKAAAAKLAKARETVKQQQQSLAGAIIEANELPPDRYAGADKADLVQRATEALKKQRPKAQVLAVRIPSGKWERETMLRYENRTLRKIDRSKLQAQVIIKRDDKIAEAHPINLWTDHMKDDAITATPLYGANEELEPQSLLLVSKVK